MAKNIGRIHLKAMLCGLIAAAPRGDCRITMRIDGGNDDHNITVKYGQLTEDMRVCLYPNGTTRVDNWVLKLLLAQALCDIPAGNHEFPDDVINDTFINAIQSGKGSVMMTIRSGKLVQAKHAL